MMIESIAHNPLPAVTLFGLAAWAVRVLHRQDDALQTTQIVQTATLANDASVLDALAVQTEAIRELTRAVDRLIQLSTKGDQVCSAN